MNTQFISQSLVMGAISGNPRPYITDLGSSKFGVVMRFPLWSSLATHSILGIVRWCTLVEVPPVATGFMIANMAGKLTRSQRSPKMKFQGEAVCHNIVSVDANDAVACVGRTSSPRPTCFIAAAGIYLLPETLNGWGMMNLAAVAENITLGLSTHITYSGIVTNGKWCRIATATPADTVGIGPRVPSVERNTRLMTFYEKPRLTFNITQFSTGSGGNLGFLPTATVTIAVGDFGGIMYNTHCQSFHGKDWPIPGLLVAGAGAFLTTIIAHMCNRWYGPWPKKATRPLQQIGGRR